MDIIRYYEDRQSLITFHYEELKKIIDACGERPEGNCFYYHQTTTEYPDLLYKRANIVWTAKNLIKIAEIGLNAGHSAVLLMAFASNNASILFFDLGSHAYVRPCFEYVKSAFGISASIVYGDSRSTIPNHIHAHPEDVGTYDVVHVDGGHEESCFFSDIACALILIRKGGYIIVDDTQVDYIHNWVNTLVGQNIVQCVLEQIPTIGYKHIIVQKC